MFIHDIASGGSYIQGSRRATSPVVINGSSGTAPDAKQLVSSSDLTVIVDESPLAGASSGPDKNR